MLFIGCSAHNLKVIPRSVVRILKFSYSSKESQWSFTLVREEVIHKASFLHSAGHFAFFVIEPLSLVTVIWDLVKDEWGFIQSGVVCLFHLTSLRSPANRLNVLRVYPYT